MSLPIDAAVVVAGLSVRAMAESLARAGVPVVALDVFGDADTRAACLEWLPIGVDGSLAIDPGRFRAAVQAVAVRRPLRGWIAGSGFEAHPGLLHDVAAGGAAGGAAALASDATTGAATARAMPVPLIGHDEATVRAVREPRAFFAALAALGLAHPAVRFEPPPLQESDDWLQKDSGSSGGWGVRPWPAVIAAEARRAGRLALAQPGVAAVPHAAQSVYWQRRQSGTPVSALFLADGRNARVVGLSEQISEPWRERIDDSMSGLQAGSGSLADVEAAAGHASGGHPQTPRRGGTYRAACLHPYVFRGAIGGLPPALVSAGIPQALAAACQALTAHARLRGLCSLDALAGPDGRLHLLELNPRPSATQALHDTAVDGGLMQAHLALCTGGPWPARRADADAAADAAAEGDAVGAGGFRIVTAPRAARFGLAALQASARRPWCHDRPAAPQALAAGQPVCTVSANLAEAGDRAGLRALLACREDEVMQWLEPATATATRPGPVKAAAAHPTCTTDLDPGFILTPSGPLPTPTLTAP